MTLASAFARPRSPKRCSRSEERRVGKECRTRWVPHQAEDGIRDLYVTGVQTCALPICVLGGISTGQDITVAIAVKPTSSIRSPRHSIDLDGNPVIVETFGRHDPCVGIRATPIAEAMLEIGRASCRERV